MAIKVKVQPLRTVVGDVAAVGADALPRIHGGENVSMIGVVSHVGVLLAEIVLDRHLLWPVIRDQFRRLVAPLIISSNGQGAREAVAVTFHCHHLGFFLAPQQTIHWYGH